jgi:hypothetical protein
MKQRNESRLKDQQILSVDTMYLQSPVYLYTKIDSLNKKPITFYLNHPAMDPLLRDIYYGKILPRYNHLNNIYRISLKSPEVLQPFFLYLSNYVSATTQIEQNIIQNEIEKNRKEEIREKLSIDSINNRPISYFLYHPDLDSIIRVYYMGEFLPSDDENTSRLLDLLTQKHKDLYPFYIHCFNQICHDSDGALSEIMGPYCLLMMINYPSDIFSYFENDSLKLNNYALLIGYELYFKEQGTSDLKTNYKDFKLYLKNNLDLEDKLTKSTYDRFFAKIDCTMIYMDQDNIPKDSLELIMK